MAEFNSLSNTEGDGVATLKDDPKPDQPSPEYVAEQAIVNFVTQRWQKGKEHRQAAEYNWQNAWRNFRGVYSPDVAFTETEKSRVFVKVTKTKTMAAYGQVLDLLFAGNKFPLSIEPSEKTDGAAETVTISTKDGSVAEEEANEQEDDFSDIISPYGFPGDGANVSPGHRVTDILGPTLAKRMEKMRDKIKVREGSEGADPQKDIVLYPAAEAAANMERTMFDQLDACSASVQLRKAILEMCALGTGGIRGPLSTYKTYHQWVKDPETGVKVYKPIKKLVPVFKSRSIWHLFPDPDATCSEDMSWIVDRHGMNRFQLRELANKPAFRKNVIEYILNTVAPDYTLEWYETNLKDDKTQTQTEKYQVLEYWGMIDKHIAEEFGMELDDAFDDVDQISINAYICGGRVLRLMLNPMTPARIPYMLVPYETNPYQIWGVGVPENMEDSQQIMNGHARMAIDNLALSGNVIFEIDENALAPGEDLRIYPGRIFKRRGGAPGQAIFSTKFQSTANENMQMFDKFRQLADDQTGIPSVTHGQAGVSGTGRTSSGLSMMMSAAGINIKTVIKNVDDYMIKPMGEGLFAWNMQFNPDDSIVGDLEIKARGTSSLMLKEVRSQRLMMFMQVAANPMFAPLIKWDTILTDIAKALEIDPKKLINSPEEAKLQALLLRDFVNTQEQQNPAAGGGPSVGGAEGEQGGMAQSTPGASASDTSGVGGGTIGTGTSPSAGETSFTGNV